MSIGGFATLRVLVLDGGFAILTGRPLTHTSNSPTRVEREAGKFFGLGSLMDRICRECTSLGSTETVENTEAQHRPGRSDREVIVVGGSAAGLFGAASGVARASGWPAIETVPLVQAIVRLPKDCPPDTTRVWFVPDDTPYFYWLIPESAERGALGVIGEHGSDTKRCFERFLEKKQLEPLEWQGARIPVYRGWVPVRRQVGNGEVYLVGDAAAQVKVSTVGGIVTGFRGALGVSEALLQNGKSRELAALRRELRTHWLIRRALHHFEQKDYSQLVDLLDASTRQSLGEINRDESTRLLWNVVRRQPRLVLLGLRGLLMGKAERS